MHNNVISSIFNELQENDISCLRFNFRGVGKSIAMHSGVNAELADVRTCIDYLINENFDKILICGYSYGAAIGCSLVNYSERVLGFCAISFPWDFMGKEFKESTQTSKPKLFIQGTMDNIASFDKFDFHYDYYKEPKSRFIVEGADHFYWGYESIISQEVLKFTKNQFEIIS
jgi:alpha/beta superfamily hydrolase